MIVPPKRFSFKKFLFKLILVFALAYLFTRYPRWLEWLLWPIIGNDLQ